MAKVALVEELTPEGQELWNNIESIMRLNKGKSLLPKKRLPKIDLNEIALMCIRTEIRKMIRNSELVIEQCDQVIATYKTKEEYYTSDAKVAKRLHTNLIERLKRVLNYKPAFDHQILVDDEGPNNLFVDTFKTAKSVEGGED